MVEFLLPGMPYIPKEERAKLDPLIDDLAEKIVAQAKECGHEASYAGILNYTCTRLAMQVIKLQFGKIRYWIIATTVGTFQNIADEFYRRIASPYEDKQIKKNGDVDLYEEFLNDMK